MTVQAENGIFIDWRFVEVGAFPSKVGTRPLLLTEDHLDNYDAFVGVVHRTLMGLRRHHALDDARANRMGWLASCAQGNSR